MKNAAYDGSCPTGYYEVAESSTCEAFHADNKGLTAPFTSSISPTYGGEIAWEDGAGYPKGCYGTVTNGVFNIFFNPHATGLTEPSTQSFLSAYKLCVSCAEFGTRRRLMGSLDRRRRRKRKQKRHKQ